MTPRVTSPSERRKLVTEKFSELFQEILPYYEQEGVHALVDDLNRAANDETGITSILNQITWMENELVAYATVDLDDQD